LPTDSFYDRDSVLNVQNKQMVTLPKTIELSGLDILYNSQQTLSSEQNGNILKINYSKNAQSEIYFISRDPKYFQNENYISELNMSSSSNMSSEESHESKEKINCSKNTTSVYFEDDLKKLKYKESHLKKSSFIQKKENTIVIKQSLIEKLKKNSSILKNNRRVRKSITNTLNNIKMPNPKKFKYNTQKSTSELWTKISETYNDISFSNFDNTSKTQIIMEHDQSKNMHYNVIEQNSSLEYNDTQERNMNSLNVDSHNDNKEEYSISSINSSANIFSNKLNHYENPQIYKPSRSNSSWPTFSDISAFTSNSTFSSDKLVSVQQKFISWSQDSSNVIDYEKNYTKQNNGTVVFNNTLSEDIQYTSKENITMVSN